MKTDLFYLIFGPDDEGENQLFVRVSPDDHPTLDAQVRCAIEQLCEHWDLVDQETLLAGDEVDVFGIHPTTMGPLCWHQKDGLLHLGRYEWQEKKWVLQS